MQDYYEIYQVSTAKCTERHIVPQRPLGVLRLKTKNAIFFKILHETKTN